MTFHKVLFIKLHSTPINSAFNVCKAMSNQALSHAVLFGILIPGKRLVLLCSPSPLISSARIVYLIIYKNLLSCNQILRKNLFFYALAHT